MVSTQRTEQPALSEDLRRQLASLRANGRRCTARTEGYLWPQVLDALVRLTHRAICAQGETGEETHKGAGSAAIPAPDSPGSRAEIPAVASPAAHGE